MNPSIVVAAVLHLWEDLPQFLGPQAWGELHPRLDTLLARLRPEVNEAERQALAKELLALLRAQPAVRARLDPLLARARRADSPRVRGPLRTPSARDREWARVAGRARERRLAHRVTRHTDITAPRSLPVGRRGVVTVGLTRTPEPRSEALAALEMEVGSLEVYLHSSSSALEVVGERSRPLCVSPSRDIEPAVFYVEGRQPGPSTLILDFRQGGSSVGEARLIVEVRGSRDAEEALTSAPGAVLAPQSSPPPAADCDLRVFTRREGGVTHLDFMLHSPNGRLGFHYQPIPGCTLERSPKEYQQYLMHKIEQLSHGRDVGGSPLPASVLPARLEALGQQLYYELFSDSLRRAYRQLRTTTRTLQITSDEPWIPWELVKPYDDSDPEAIIDDDFLCARYQLTRWLAGTCGPASHVPVAAYACVAAASPPDHEALRHVTEEGSCLAALAQDRSGLHNLSPEPATLDAVEGLLAGSDVQLWHFAAHGNAQLAQPNESLIVLADGSKLRPDSIFGRRQTRIARQRPLVFLNVCRSAQQGWGLTRLGGWVDAWVNRAHCGGLIGPFWYIDDGLACQFACSLYRRLAAGETLGEAALGARLRARQLNPANPTWLAYSVYGHPNARVVL